MNNISTIIFIIAVMALGAFVVGYLDGQTDLIRHGWYIDSGKLFLGPAVMTA